MISAQEIKKQLTEKLRATLVDVRDESLAHRGHAESQKSGGGHYQALIVSPIFSGKSRVERHRLVYQTLSLFMGRYIHALAIQALTQEEYGSLTSKNI
jgi:BolA protein